MNALPDQQAPVARQGLRERKKARTRAAIREHAFRLFREQGYDATTVEQIADAAEVSPSTFFRYVPTKEDVVLQDDMDMAWFDALKVQPAGLSPIAALRAAMWTAFAGLSSDEMANARESVQLSMRTPAVRARMLEELARTIGLISQAVAERAGRDPSDVAVQTLAGAVVGVAVTAWFAADGELEKFGQNFDQGLELLEAGLPL
ncbi:MAG TPA: TetR family transcriptional regulator [Streptosporangiaceae bacterium]|nr:TetR family transcriptional regulator [Streptosporangiaceae bacterium]